MALADEKYRRTLEVLSIDDLEIDEAYQRPLSQKHVEEILADLEVAAADAISVSKRKNGKLYIVNGQHVAAALKLSGETEILAFVYVGLTPKEEARLRLIKNHSRGDTSLEKFHARIASGEAKALAIQKLLGEFGTHVNRSPSKYSGINSVAALDWLMDDSPDQLRWTMVFLRDAFDEISGDAASGDMIKGVHWFIKVHPGEYSRKDLVSRVRTGGPEDVLRRARNHKSVSGGAGWLNVYRALVEIYNYRRTERSKLEMKTRYWSEEKSRTRTGLNKTAATSGRFS